MRTPRNISLSEVKWKCDKYGKLQKILFIPESKWDATTTALYWVGWTIVTLSDAGMPLEAYRE